MQHYSEKTLKSKPHFVHTSYKNCTPLQRCNNAKQCPRCATLKRKRDFAKATNHLTEKHIKNYKHKNFLTIISKAQNISPITKNENIDNFMRDLLKGKKRDSSILKNSQYFINKHIDKSVEFGINPHFHIILLSQKSFKYSKTFKKLLNKYNLRVHNKAIYKKRNNYINSIKSLVNYCLKSSFIRNEIERDYKLTKHKQDLFKSTLFSKRKLSKKAKCLYRHIRTARAELNKQRTQARRIFRNYNKSNPSTYLRMLKSLKKKLCKIEKAKLRLSKQTSRSEYHFVLYIHLLSKN